MDAEKGSVILFNGFILIKAVMGFLLLLLAMINEICLFFRFIVKFHDIFVAIHINISHHWKTILVGRGGEFHHTIHGLLLYHNFTDIFRLVCLSVPKKTKKNRQE